MTEADTTRLSDLIRSRLRELQDEDTLGQQCQAVVQLDQQAVGRLSRMDALQNQAMATAQQTRRNIEKQQLLAALSRIEEGEYGYCEDCGEDIPIRRLELNPVAAKCVNCASG